MRAANVAIAAINAALDKPIAIWNINFLSVYFVTSSISFSIVHVSVASFKPTAGVQPRVECTLQKLYAATNRLIAFLWFSSFRDQPKPKRANRLLKCLTVRLERSTNDVLILS